MNDYIPIISPLVIIISVRVFIFLLQCTMSKLTLQKVIKIGVIFSFIYLTITFSIFIFIFDFYIFPIVSLIIIWAYFILMSFIYENYFERMKNNGTLL